MLFDIYDGLTGGGGCTAGAVSKWVEVFLATFTVVCFFLRSFCGAVLLLAWHNISTAGFDFSFYRFN